MKKISYIALCGFNIILQPLFGMHSDRYNIDERLFSIVNDNTDNVSMHDLTESNQYMMKYATVRYLVKHTDPVSTMKIVSPLFDVTVSYGTRWLTGLGCSDEAYTTIPQMYSLAHQIKITRRIDDIAAFKQNVISFARYELAHIRSHLLANGDISNGSFASKLSGLMNSFARAVDMIDARKDTMDLNVFYCFSLKVPSIMLGFANSSAIAQNIFFKKTYDFDTDFEQMLGESQENMQNRMNVAAETFTNIEAHINGCENTTALYNNIMAEKDTIDRTDLSLANVERFEDLALTAASISNFGPCAVVNAIQMKAKMLEYDILSRAFLVRDLDSVDNDDDIANVWSDSNRSVVDSVGAFSIYGGYCDGNYNFYSLLTKDIYIDLIGRKSYEMKFNGEILHNVGTSLADRYGH